jgi:hypothetical protein
MWKGQVNHVERDMTQPSKEISLNWREKLANVNQHQTFVVITYKGQLRVLEMWGLPNRCGVMVGEQNEAPHLHSNW